MWIVGNDWQVTDSICCWVGIEWAQCQIGWHQECENDWYPTTTHTFCFLFFFRLHLMGPQNATVTRMYRWNASIWQTNIVTTDINLRWQVERWIIWSMILETFAEIEPFRSVHFVFFCHFPFLADENRKQNRFNVTSEVEKNTEILSKYQRRKRTQKSTK